MKKATLTLAATLLFAISTHAQDRSTRLGLQVSPNMGWITTDEDAVDNDGSRLGYRFGLLGDFQLGSNANYFFSTGAFLNNVGAKLKTTLSDSARTTFTSESKFQYVEVPITVKLKTNEIGYMTYYGQIGFGTAFNISAKSDFDQPDANGKITRVTDEDIMDNTQLFKASLIVGAGLEFNFSGNTSAMIGVTYNNGFTNINKDVKIGETELKAKQNYLELSLGVFF